MATFKGIRGIKVQSVASDPSPFSEGDVWYNTTSSTLKYYVAGSGAWASANAIPANRGNSGSCGTTTAALYVGGSEPAPALNQALEFDGTNWSLGGSLTVNSSRVHTSATAGTQTAGLVAGGTSPATATCEEYDGTSWTAGGTMTRPAATTYGGMIGGIQTAALSCASEGSPSKAVESYDGTSWTAGTALTSTHARSMGSQIGTQTACICVGSESGPTVAYTEEWNGSAWSEKNDLNTGRGIGGSGGTVTASLVFGGHFYSVPTGQVKYASTEKFDGTSWTEVGDLAAAKSYVYGCGTQGAALLAGGVTGPSSSPNSVTAEVWTEPIETTKTVTVS